jgi:hypothetical protein
MKGLRRSALAQDDQGVHGRHPAVQADYERVDVHLGHVLKLHAYAGETDQGADKLIAGRRCLAAERPEEHFCPQFIDHLPGMVFIHGSDAEGDVVEGLGEDAAKAEHDDRTELGIKGEAGDELPAAGEHRLDQVPLEIGPCGRGHLLRCPAYVPGILQIQMDETPLRFVGQFRTQALQDDRKPYLLRGGHGLL